MSPQTGPRSSDNQDRTEYGGGPGPAGSRTNAPAGLSAALGAHLTPAQRATLLRRAGAAESETIGTRLRRPGAPLHPIQTPDMDTPPEFGVRIA